MTKKYIFSTPYLPYQEACLELLDAMADKGYKLVKVGLFFVFEKVNYYPKHKIDITPRNDEYNQLVTDLGYEYIGNCGKMNFYVSDFPNVEDLMSDPEVLKQQRLKKYQPKHLFNALITLIIWVPYVLKYELSNISFSLVDYYLNPEQYFSNLLTLFIFLIILLLGVISSIKRDAVLKDTYHFHKLKGFDYFLAGFVFTYLIFAIVTRIIFKNISLFHCLVPAGFILFYYFDQYVYAKEISKIDQIYTGKALFVTYILLVGLFFLGTYFLPNPYTDYVLNPFDFEQKLDSLAYKETHYTKLTTGQLTNQSPFLDINDSDYIYLECKEKKVYDACLEEMTKGMDKTSSLVYTNNESIIITDELFIYKAPYDEQINILETTTSIKNYYHKPQD